MDTSFQRSISYSDEWYTPREIVMALNRLDLDPCAAPREVRPFETADLSYDIDDNGLSREWTGRV